MLIGCFFDATHKIVVKLYKAQTHSQIDAPWLGVIRGGGAIRGFTVYSCEKYVISDHEDVNYAIAI